MVQGPTLMDFERSFGSAQFVIETGAITGSKPMNLHRLSLWKRARVGVQGRPDWLFIKLHCHGMDPTQKDAVVGEPFRRFLEELVGGAAERNETLHFTSAREMANILLAACEGREGNPGGYRDYRFKRVSHLPVSSAKGNSTPVSVKG